MKRFIRECEFILLVLLLVKHHGNLSLEQIIEIARTTRVRSLAKELSGTVREILGTCSSMGCSVEGMNPRDMSAKIASGEIEIPVK
jgi:large subunit ribosomal protein L12e